MTLGEFRKHTRDLSDNCTISFAESFATAINPNLVGSMLVVITDPTDSEPKPVPNIVLMREEEK